MRKIFVKTALLIALGFTSIIVHAQQHITLNTYSGQSEIKASGSVTLTDGFYAPAGSNLRIYTGASYANCFASSFLPSASQNYILSTVFKAPGVNVSNINNGRSACDVNGTIQYIDGLGRLLQTVNVQASPSGNDIIQPVAYDNFGREKFKYLPYSEGGNNGLYRTNALSGGQNTFYNSQPASSGIPNTASPFSETVFEASPLNRMEQQGAPGDAWQISNSHTLKMEYGTNQNEVKLWTITATGAYSNSNYAPGKLYKTTTKDENWTTGDGLAGTKDEYKDFEGRIVLKRVWETANKSLSTYYVYDDFGNLRYVLPPAVNENGQAALSSFNEGDTNFNYFIYAYHYDGRKRLVEKKMPGKGWEEMVYNPLDQVVLTRDEVQKNNGQWLFTKYDALGRTVIMGLYNDGASRSALQATVNGQGSYWEVRPEGGDYSNNAFPQTISYYHSVSYYDDYSFPGNNFGVPTGAGQVSGNRTRGLLTGSKVTTLGTGTMLLTVNYYDEEGRVLQSKSEHQLNGIDVVSNSYNFAGELTNSTRLHTANNVATTIFTRYEYDHWGRKVATFDSINGQNEVALSHLEYNEIGQLKNKKLHNDMQSTGFAYNERGWLKSSMSNEFSMQLNYQDGTIPQWNGNIANQYWGTGNSFPNVYTYDYDKLNRLKSGVSSGISMSENITYDEMGNIKTLARDGSNANFYHYNGNQLWYAEYVTNGYAYDANGNATTDGRNGMTLTYNYLNLPATANKSGTSLAYTYNAAGQKLAKNYNGSIRNYINGIEYKPDGTIDVIHTEEGLAQNNSGTYTYKYNLSDHLGNVRYTFDIYNGAVRRLQSDDYYAFGKRRSVSPVSTDNKYLYNGKELQDELGEQYDYGARFYDPVIGRWNVIDPFAEKMRRHSQYNYGFNNPIRFVDPNGMMPYDWYQSEDGKKIQWFDGSGPQKGYNNLGSTAVVSSTKGDVNLGSINLNADGTATNAQTGEIATASISGKTDIIGKVDNTVKDAMDWAGTGLDVTAAGLTMVSESKMTSLMTQEYTSGASGLMGATAQSAKSLSGFSSALGYGSSAITVGVLAVEGQQVSRGQMDSGRFGYHVAGAVGAAAIGAKFGGVYGAAAGLAAKSGEMGYDFTKQTYYTLNGQWNNFVQSIVNATMGGR